jgi:predicted nuclease of predicted toxin-antitoxin system
MEQIRFYLDEHIPRAVAEGLRGRGLDVLTVQDAGRISASDSVQLAFAFAERRVIVTMDSDFLILASQGTQHAGIAYASQQSIGELIRAVMLLYDVLSPEEMMNHVEFL